MPVIGVVEWDSLRAATHSAWVVTGVGAIFPQEISKNQTKEKGAKLLDNVNSYISLSVVLL